MSTSPAGHMPAAPTWQPLEARERRVLGVMIEKAKTTPATYPMSVNAILVGCNQKNNRDPLTAFDDTDVENALGKLCKLGVASEIDWLGRVSKFKHHAYEWLGVSKVELAVMAELLLRGAQTLGDLRGRAARMEPITDIEALKTVVDGLCARRLMIELTPPGRGQIVSHNLHSANELSDLRSALAGHVHRESTGERDDSGSRGSGHSYSAIPPSPTAPREGAGGLAAVSAEVADLRAEVARLREQVRVLEIRIEKAGG